MSLQREERKESGRIFRDRPSTRAHARYILYVHIVWEAQPSANARRGGYVGSDVAVGKRYTLVMAPEEPQKEGGEKGGGGGERVAYIHLLVQSSSKCFAPPALLSCLASSCNVARFFSIWTTSAASAQSLRRCFGGFYDRLEVEKPPSGLPDWVRVRMEAAGIKGHQVGSGERKEVDSFQATLPTNVLRPPLACFLDGA